MQLSLKSAIAASVLALASTSAFAQQVITVPQGPGPAPTVADPAGGGVLLSAWDEARGLSVTQYLNLRIGDIQVDDLTPAGGLVLNFGTIDLSVFGGNTAGVIYNVVAGDFVGPNSAPLDWQVSFTGNLAQTSFYANGDSMAGSLSNLNTHQQFLNQACGTTNPCVATSAAQQQYAGGVYFERDLGNGLPIDTTGAIGSALSFWTLTSTSDLLGDDATTTQYANANGIGQWMLQANGSLTYSIAGSTAPVPLPAAAWLLVSGLAGLGVIGRRRKVA